MPSDQFDERRVEAVARAICKAAYGHLRGYVGREPHYARLAQAAILRALDKEAGK